MSTVAIVTLIRNLILDTEIKIVPMAKSLAPPMSHRQTEADMSNQLQACISYSDNCCLPFQGKVTSWSKR